MHWPASASSVYWATYWHLVWNSVSHLGFIVSHLGFIVFHLGFIVSLNIVSTSVSLWRSIVSGLFLGLFSDVMAAFRCYELGMFANFNFWRWYSVILQEQHLLTWKWWCHSGCRFHSECLVFSSGLIESYRQQPCFASRKQVAYLWMWSKCQWLRYRITSFISTSVGTLTSPLLLSSFPTYGKRLNKI